ncbi:uncharacterized protein LOC143462667 [Clavelina lepadiformis]|uniref:Snake toxin/toxin-like domain-containing protein n=1 Tax=Clavelina lepadiformis TaxID=159417 RepID=A0ABP0GLR2_CLALP
MKTLQIAILLGILFIYKCSSLKCYKCTASVGIDNCIGGMPKNCTGLNAMCSVTIYNMPGRNSIVYGCSDGSIAPGCSFGIFGRESCTAYCFSDGCNLPFVAAFEKEKSYNEVVPEF